MILLVSLFFSSSVMAQYRLEKTGEFSINSMYPVGLIDYHTAEGLYLGYIDKFSGGMEIAIIHENGEILISKNLHGEGPEEYTTTLNGLGFSEEGDIWVQTTHQLLRYDRKLNLKERIKHQSTLSYHLRGRPKKVSWFRKNDDASDFSLIVNPSKVGNFLRKISFEHTRLIEIFSLKENLTYKIAPISERPQYRDFDMNISAMYAPLYYLDRETNQLYLSTTLDDEITVYDLNTDEVISRIIIRHEDYNSLKTIPITRKSLPAYDNLISLAAVNQQIYKLDRNLIALEYVREIPYGTYEKRIADDPHYHHYRDPEYRRLILFDHSEQLSDDIPVPYGTIQLVLPNNRFVVQLVNPDLEEGFIRYGIFELVKH
ncbi:hypothetical protein [Negadavirga shengliensis]|uniref:Uncharacterized protein n=1 Tax=Negadavirga shengliensis TaxID=1389218 RepID=A0ABV9T7H4_9BACT